MKILVTGAGGQLGRETVLALGNKNVQVQSITRKDLDFSRPDRVADFISRQKADWVINCAAYTQVDKAEVEAELAFCINRDCVGALAKGVKNSGGRLLHLSTDFVFSGESSRPYEEADIANPLGIYGRSKWEGEQVLRDILPDSIIVRTAWVYGIYGQNFLKSILRLASERQELRVVDDQLGTPTWTADIVRAMWALITANAVGTCHFTNEGVASWYDFSDAIVANAKSYGMPITVRNIMPIPSEAYPTAAKRPHYSVLSNKKIRGELEYDIPHWRSSLDDMFSQLLEMEAQ